MEKISNLFAKERRVSGYVKDWQAIATLQRDQMSFLGKLAKNFTLRYFKNGTLHMVTPNYVWVQEIRRFKPLLIKKGNEILGRSLIKDIRVSYEKKQSQKKSPLKE